MRIYIPATLRDVDRDAISERLVHAHTAQLEKVADLRDVPPGEQRDVLEAMVMNAAADDSLRLLAACEKAESGSVVPRRVVIVAEVEGSFLELPGDEQLPTARTLIRPLSWKHVESIHIDDDEALDDIGAAMAGDEAAFERSYEYELMWYDVSEREDLISAFKR